MAAGDWLVEGETQTVNCTADSSQLPCLLDDVGEGTGGVLENITPGLILLIAGIGIISAIVYLIRRVLSV